MKKINIPKMTITIDKFIMESGACSQLDLFVALGIVEADDLSAWQTKQKKYLEDFFTIPFSTVLDCVKQAIIYADKVGLDYKNIELFGLSVCRDAQYEKLFSLSYFPKKISRQMDLFYDNTEMVLNSGVIEAFAENKPDQVLENIEKLNNYHKDHPHVSAFNTLYRTLYEPDHGISTDFLDAIEKQIVPLAQKTLGIKAVYYVQWLWEKCDLLLQDVAFNREKPKRHQYYTACMLKDWGRVQQLIEPIDHWFSDFILCQNLAVAYYYTHQKEKSLSIWLYACWQFPSAMINCIKSDETHSIEIENAWSRFVDLPEDLDTGYFPSFFLLDHQNLAALLNPFFQPIDNQYSQLYRFIIKYMGASKENNNQKMIAFRQHLKNKAPVLFDYYMQQIR